MGITHQRKTVYFFGETPLEGVSHLPLVQTQFINPNITSLRDFDFLIVTSKRSIIALQSFDYDFGNIELFCVGEKTASYAKKLGLNVVHESRGYAKDLISEILPLISQKKGLYLRPKTVANDYIKEHVRRGLLAEAVCYETLCLQSTSKQLIHPAVLLFAAPSQVNCFLKHFNFNPEDEVIVIGQTTAQALPKGIKFNIASTPSLEVMVEEALA